MTYKQINIFCLNLGQGKRDNITREDTAENTTTRSAENWSEDEDIQVVKLKNNIFLCSVKNLLRSTTRLWFIWCTPQTQGGHPVQQGKVFNLFFLFKIFERHTIFTTKNKYISNICYIIWTGKYHYFISYLNIQI